MGSGKLAVYGLGRGGCNVDKSPIHLEDNELTKAQNAVQSKQSSTGTGTDGGLVKRPALTKYNAASGAGSIPGVVNVPLGPGPGTTTDDKVTYYIALQVGTTPFWRISTDSFSTSATTTVINTRIATSSINGSAMLNGRLYYLADTVGINRSIRVFDGAQDRLFSSLPTGYTFLRLFALKGALYVGVANGTSAAYVYKLDSDGRLYQIGAALPTAIVDFHGLAYHNSDLYVTGKETGVAGKIYRIREFVATTATAWTLDYTHPDAAGIVYAMESFKGNLYATRGGAGATTGAMLKRSAAASYSVVDDYLSVPSLGHSVKEFNGSLYSWISQYNNGNNAIRSSSDGSSWAFTFLPGNANAFIAQFFVVGNKLFVWKDGGTSNSSSAYYTTNGSSWTTTPNLDVSSPSMHGFGYFRN